MSYYVYDMSEKRDIEAKPQDNFVETSTNDGIFDKEAGVAREGADYSGAVEKTSPEEIALVRKLDFRIMPTLWCMYFLNYVSTVFTQPSRLWNHLLILLRSSIEMPSHKQDLTVWRKT